MYSLMFLFAYYHFVIVYPSIVGAGLQYVWNGQGGPVGCPVLGGATKGTTEDILVALTATFGAYAPWATTSLWIQNK